MRVLVPHRPGDVRAAVTAALAADPVGNTVLGSALAVGHDALWCALRADDPTLLAVHSSSQHPVALTAGWNAADAAALADVISGLASVAGLSGPEPVVEAVASILVADSGRAVRDRRAERLFRLDDLDPPAGVAGWDRPAVADDADLLREWIAGFAAEARASAAVHLPGQSGLELDLPADRLPAGA